MATVPEAATIPGLAPSPMGAPSLRASTPDTLAGTLGKALGQTGQAADQLGQALGQHALGLQALTNATDANNRTADTVQRGQELLNEYSQLSLKAAQEGYPAFQQSIQDLFKAGGAGLNPTAKVQYEDQARRQLLQISGQGNTHAVSEGHKYLVQSNDAVIKTFGDQAVAAGGTDEALANFNAGLGHSLAIINASTGLKPDDPIVQQQFKTYRDPVYAEIVRQKYMDGDITGAQAFFDAHKSEMTIDGQSKVDTMLRAAVQDSVVQSAALAVANGQPMTDTRPSGGAGGIAQAIHGQESNSNPNVRDSPAGAVGIGQIEPGTWAQWQKLGLVKPGEDIRNATDNLNVSNRAIEYYSKEYNGDNRRVAVAYYSGEGNVAPAGSANPWKRDVQPPSGGPTVSQYVSQVMGRMGAAPQKAAIAVPPPPKILPNEDPQQAKADIDTYVQKWGPVLFGDNPGLAAKVMDASKNMAYTKIQAVAAAQAAAANRLQNAISSGAQNGTAVSSEADLAHAYPGADKDLALLPPKDHDSVMGHINLAANGYGAYKTPAMSAEADRLEGLRLSDPAGFADPVKTNINQANISSPDKMRLLTEQANDARNQQRQVERQATLQSYLANPVISSMIKTNFPDRQGEAYMTFLGAIEGRVQALGLPPGQRPTPEQLQKIATDLVTTQGGWFGIGGTRGYAVPADASREINEAYKQSFGRDLSVAEIAKIYQYNRLRSPGA
jgi:hypothetical protein